MLSNLFDWMIEKKETRLELASPDGAWHVSVWKDEDGQSSYLHNTELLTGPRATGKDTAECMKNFIESCDKYVKKVRKARDEATRILEEYGKHKNG